MGFTIAGFWSAFYGALIVSIVSVFFNIVLRLDRVRVVLRDERSYELRDVDGTPISWQEARAIIAERYQVPKEVRLQRSHQAHKARRDRQAERKQKRRSHQVSERLTVESHFS